MARIRSIHPKIFTDEAFMVLSSHARTLLFGVLCEADDGGVIKWSPVQLKARYLPADSVDGSALLAELVQAGWLRCYEVAGAGYAAIRKFRRWQRPKEPSLVHPMPDDLLGFVCGVDGRPAVGRPPSVDRTPAPEPETVMVQADLPLPDMRPTAAVLPIHAASATMAAALPENTASTTIPEFPEIRVQREEGGGKKERDMKNNPIHYTPPDLTSVSRRETPAGVVVATPIVAAFNAYNATARALGLPSARVMTEARRVRLRQRLRECGGLDGWNDALAAVQRSAGLCGHNDSGWKANLDWMLGETAFTRLMEGSYDAWGRPAKKMSFYNDLVDALDRQMEAVA